MTQSIFAAPYQAWNAEQILAYYQQRTHVGYFPLRDAEQATSAKIADVLVNRFTFNDESYTLPSNFVWTENPSADKEWLILLHKFYFAAGLGAEYCQTGDRRYLDKWVELTEAWIDSVPLNFLSSDVTGRRLQNWIFAHYYFVSDAYRTRHEAAALESQRLSGKARSSLFQAILEPTDQQQADPAGKFVDVGFHSTQAYAHREHRLWKPAPYQGTSPTGSQSECVSPQRRSCSPEFYQKFLLSLHHQVNYLCENLTPARNHRTIELYAIFMAAVIFPEMKEAERWLEFSRHELLANIQTDVLADGVHCELSTDYHHLVLRNYLGILKLAACNQIAMPAALEERVGAALAFAKYVHKPDGLVPALSDGDVRGFADVLLQGYHYFGDEELLYVATAGAQGKSPGQRSKVFAESGYVILRSGWGDRGEAFADERYLIFDCGPLGAGNHGHLDLLSFEMAAYGQSLIVDPGRYTYHETHPDLGETNWRATFRGTAYHNTVQVDGKEQTRYEFHKTRFKLRGPEPEHALKAFCDQGDSVFVQGFARSHEYPVTHERTIEFVQGRYWIVTDRLCANESHRYDLRFHLSHQAWGKAVATIVDELLVVSTPHLLLIQPYDPNVTVAMDEGYISPSYGIKYPAPIVRFACQGAEASFQTVLYPHPAAEFKALAGFENLQGLVRRGSKL